MCIRDRLWYRVDEEQLLALLAKTDPPAEPDAGPEGLDPAVPQMEGKPPTGRLEASPPDGGKTANWSATPPPAITETTTAVSYTHLDVYKRQSILRAASQPIESPWSVA